MNYEVQKRKNLLSTKNQDANFCTDNKIVLRKKNFTLSPQKNTLVVLPVMRELKKGGNYNHYPKKRTRITVLASHFSQKRKNIQIKKIETQYGPTNDPLENKELPYSMQMRQNKTNHPMTTLHTSSASNINNTAIIHLQTQTHSTIVDILTES